MPQLINLYDLEIISRDYEIIPEERGGSDEYGNYEVIPERVNLTSLIVKSPTSNKEIEIIHLLSYEQIEDIELDIKEKL